MGAGHVIHGDVLHAGFRQAVGQQIGGVLRVAVHGGVADGHGLVLGLVAAPQVVLAQQVAQIAAPHRPVQGADGLNVQPRELFQGRLDLGAVFAHNVGVVAAGVLQPILVEVHLVVEQGAVHRAEGAEGVGGEQDLLALLIADHHLGPVDHGGGVEAQGVLAQLQGVALLDHQGVAVHVEVVELANHLEGFGVAHNLQVGIVGQQHLNGGAVVGLHVVDDEVIQGLVPQRGPHVLDELQRDGGVHRVQQSGFLVQNDVGVVRHPPGDGEEVLKQGQAAVAAAHPNDRVADVSCIDHGLLLSKDGARDWPAPAAVLFPRACAGPRAFR